MRVGVHLVSVLWMCRQVRLTGTSARTEGRACATADIYVVPATAAGLPAWKRDTTKRDTTVPLLLNGGSFSKASAPPLFLEDDNIFQKFGDVGTIQN